METEKTKSKYLSVITNFGCHYSCPYCIVKNCGIDIPKTTLEGLDGLEETILKYGCTWVSVSGGGDPFHKLEEHIDWWNKFFDITENCIVESDRAGVNIELHTSYLPDTYEDEGSPFAPFNRVVYHCRNISDLFRIKRFGGQTVRVVFVVTETATREKIDEIAAIVKHHPEIDELSFRQMVDNNYQTTHYCEEYLREWHQKKWWYIEQCDYNIYYAENEVKFRYEDFKSEKLSGTADNEDFRNGH